MIWQPKHIHFISAILLFFLLCSADVPKTTPKGVKTIVIDAGHGGKDPGCNGSSQLEKNVALGIALKLGELIEKKMPEVKVIYTRKTDEFVELEERAQIANRNEADLFISIHCNAASKYDFYKDKHGKIHYKTYKDKRGKIRKIEVHNPKPFGSATYVMGISNEKGKLNTAKRENASMLLEDNYQKTYNGFDPQSDEAYIIMSLWTGAFVEQSADLASKIQKEYVRKAGRIDKGVQRQSIWVLWRTAMPSVLTEVGFLTNPEEEKFLGSDKGQQYMASALFRAIRTYKDTQEGLNKKYDDEIEKQEPLTNENLSKGNKSDENNGDTTQIADDANEELYNGFIKEADEHFKTKKYEDALMKYQKCNDLKPEERYPLAKIEECNKKISEQKNGQNQQEQQQKETQNKYQSLLNSADKLAAQKNWNAAIAQYQQASDLFPENPYPKEKIKEMDKNNADEKQRLKEKEEKYYQDLIKKRQEKARADSLASLKKIKTDSTKISAADMANSYKGKTPKKENTNTEGGTVIFCVQFAMSETEPNLKADKYKNIENSNYYKAGSIFKITAGSFSKPNDAIALQNKMRQEGYKDCFVIALKNGKRIDFKEAAKQVETNEN
ncbi:MAG: N-acetylmuramoyl-L-alanine amidase [Bacteroidetes bacterium]|nr:N-acetylmuramoyl-L-alanine amidase [Bacteroidota bacterium]